MLPLVARRPLKTEPLRFNTVGLKLGFEPSVPAEVPVRLVPDDPLAIVLVLPLR